MTEIMQCGTTFCGGQSSYRTFVLWSRYHRAGPDIVRTEGYLPPMAKLQRWIDLLAALLRRNQPASLDELKEDVPGYLRLKNLAALRRAFERDKADLREFGIPILTISDSAGEVMGYQMKRDSFYLPYLSLIRDAGRTSPERIDRYGYRALPELSFEADELAAVAEAARRVAQLGDPALTTLAQSAMRKLAFDLPVDSVQEFATHMYVGAAPLLSAAEILEELDDALRRRKRVTITYHTFGSDKEKSRVVQPYGLFFLGSHWYLAAREDDAGPVKNFRVNRIRSIKVNGAQPDTHDYEIPANFDLRAHSASRQAWEAGRGRNRRGGGGLPRLERSHHGGATPG